MIKFTAMNKETLIPVLGIGLSRENCERLIAGVPIVFQTTNMPGMPPIEVVIMGGETEQGMADIMIKAGHLRPDQIHSDPSLGDSISKGVQ